MNCFWDCFGEILFNPIFEHELMRIRRSVLHKKCSLACPLEVCKISDLLENFKDGFMLGKFGLVYDCIMKEHGFINFAFILPLHLVMLHQEHCKLIFIALHRSW